MKVMVVGKEHFEGTSKKTGSPFSLNIAHCTHKKNGVEGTAVSTVMLDARTYPYDDILTGSEYDVDRDERGYVVDFQLV